MTAGAQGADSGILRDSSALIGAIDAFFLCSALVHPSHATSSPPSNFFMGDCVGSSVAQPSAGLELLWGSRDTKAPLNAMPSSSGAALRLHESQKGPLEALYYL